MHAGLSLAKKIAIKRYPEYSHNLYLVHFTDGDCHGIDIDEEYIEQFNKWVERFPDLEKEFDTPELGNPLTDYLIPRSSAVFVSEARVYGEGNNYSDMLKKLVDLRPSLDSKIRCKSFPEDEIEARKGELIKETLLH